MNQPQPLTEIDTSAMQLIMEERRAREAAEWKKAKEKLVRSREERRFMRGIRNWLNTGQNEESRRGVYIM